MGKAWDKVLPDTEIFKECLRVLKPGSFAFVMSAPRSDVQYRMVQMLDEVGFEVGFTPIYWAYATGFPKAMNISKAVAKRGDIDEAKKLDGSYAGYQPKPAVEVVIVAMKPLDQKGYLDQVLDNGKGATWLDDCRIPFAGMSDTEQYGSDTYERISAFGDTEQSETEDGRNLWGKKATKKVKITKRQPRTDHNVFKQSGFKSEENDTAEASPLGRFAANLLVSDNVLDTGKKTKSSGGRSYQNTNNMYSGGWAHDDLGTNENPGKGDIGDFSRYYSLDEWWKFRVSRLPKEIQRTFPFLIVPKASKFEKNTGMKVKGTGSNTYNKKCLKCGKWQLKQGFTDAYTCRCKNPEWEVPTGNVHPTVKPIQLFSYLVTLGSRKGDVILDPFAGSGTTGIACVFSERNYILIEKEKEYYDIMEARIKKAKNPAGLVQHEWF